MGSHVSMDTDPYTGTFAAGKMEPVGMSMTSFLEAPSAFTADMDAKEDHEGTTAAV